VDGVIGVEAHLSNQKEMWCFFVKYCSLSPNVMDMARLSNTDVLGSLSIEEELCLSMSKADLR